MSHDSDDAALRCKLAQYLSSLFVNDRAALSSAISFVLL